MTAPRNTPADRRRGDAILAVIQAQRAFEAETEASNYQEFDEAYAIVERLVADGYLVLDRAAAMAAHPAGKGNA